MLILVMAQAGTIALTIGPAYNSGMAGRVSASERAGQKLWTAAEFLDWLAPGVHADLIDGERFMHSPVSMRHARLLNFIERLLGSYIELKELGELHREVVAVRLSARNVFSP